MDLISLSMKLRLFSNSKRLLSSSCPLKAYSIKVWLLRMVQIKKTSVEDLSSCQPGINHLGAYIKFLVKRAISQIDPSLGIFLPPFSVMHFKLVTG